MAAFSIAALQMVDVKEPQCQILIIEPTRELTRNTRDVNIVCNIYYN